MPVMMCVWCTEHCFSIHRLCDDYHQHHWRQGEKDFTYHRWGLKTVPLNGHVTCVRKSVCVCVCVCVCVLGERSWRYVVRCGPLWGLLPCTDKRLMKEIRWDTPPGDQNKLRVKDLNTIPLTAYKHPPFDFCFNRLTSALTGAAANLLMHDIVFPL